MIGPGRGGEVDRLRLGATVEAGEEEGTKVDGTGARDGLERLDLEDACVVTYCSAREKIGVNDIDNTLSSFRAGLAAPKISL